MSALLLVLLLYNLPGFITDSSGVLRALLLTALGLVLDAAAHLLIYKRPVCAVSAAVTALILYTLSPGVAVGFQCLALAAALVIGKTIWGGTGKNPLNPAMLGFVLLAFFVPVSYPPFTPAPALLPAVLLSLPFLFVRPYAGLGMILGISASLLLRHDLTFSALIAWGVPFWGCLVITDPVTTTSRPAAGLVIGALAGFVAMAAGSTPAAMPLCVLLSNILSWQADRLRLGWVERLRKTFGLRQKICFSPEQTPYIDMTGEDPAKMAEEGLACGAILDRLDAANVTGCGGAAFPTAIKIRAAMDSGFLGKHLIINAVECDPGLLHDKWLLTHRRDDIQSGLGLLQNCILFKTVTVAAKDFYGVKFDAPVRLFRARDYYPSGAEKLLVKDVLKIDLQPDEIPSECGILVLNIQTVAAINDAVRLGRNADSNISQSPILTAGPVLSQKCGWATAFMKTARRVFPNPVLVYTGGGAMSALPADDDAVVDSKTNFLGVGRARAFREALCSQCKRLQRLLPPRSCPFGRSPKLLDAGSTEKALKLHPGACIECNLCSAVCPAGARPGAAS